MSALAPLQPNPAARAGMAPSPADAPMPLRRGLSRNKPLFAISFLALAGLGLAIVAGLPERYRATAQLVFQDRSSGFGGSALLLDRGAIETEAAIVASRDLALRAVESLRLIDDPAFNPALQPSASFAFGAWLRDHVLAPLGVAPSSGSGRASQGSAVIAPPPAVLAERAVDAYLDRLSVSPADNARIVAVDFTAADPDLAAAAANRTAGLYVEDRVAQRAAAARRADEWLGGRLERLREEAAAAQQRLDAYRRETGMLEIGGGSIYRDQLTQVNAQLVAARGSRTEAEARAAQARRLIGQGSNTGTNTGGGLETAAAVLNADLVRELRLQEAALQRRIAELRVEYRDDHPRLQEALSESEGLRRTIAGEVEKIGIGLANEVEVARARERALQQEVDRLQVLVDDRNDALLSLRALEGDLRSRTQLYEVMLARFNEAKLQDERLVGPEARVISAAVPPAEPLFPGKAVLAVLAVLVAAVLAAGIAMLRERLRKGYGSVRQVERSTGLPVLGALPALSRASLRGMQPHELALDDPAAAYAEAVRGLRTGLLLAAAGDRPVRTLLVTSSIAGEGKTATAVSLAALAAKAGRKVLLIDADLRDPGIGPALYFPHERGLATYLAGAASAEAVTEFHLACGIYFIPAGPAGDDPSALLSAPAMQTLLQQKAGEFDLVVIDSPPVLPVSDALILSRLVDATLYVVAAESVRRDAVRAGLQALRQAGAAVAGTVLTRLDPRRQPPEDAARYAYAAPASGQTAIEERRRIAG
ncbi:GumC family protein [Oceanibaculum pacificum]|uniref:CobQ/CobB/MinD/ParA nucleotide binding domain-containing protein n=1 Tax=Oceanibaculum pacificum TaxID=580166 RepID=A0A154VE85_9PROT|nr:polysaccharide biosynthesis tyrosine autokinase [Oceanibaculum pacificum]KZC99604.1 hypothetical protein AUP43_14535 [Oceanibaculum pacificum]